MKKGTQTLEQQHVSLEKQLHTHLEVSNEKNQYERRECLEIRGIPLTNTVGNTDDIIKEVGKLVDVELVDQDISVSHRLPQRKSFCMRARFNVGPPPIIVKFTRQNVKERLYRARRKLNGKTTFDLGYIEDNKIYLAESLTEINR